MDNIWVTIGAFSTGPVCALIAVVYGKRMEATREERSTAAERDIKRIDILFEEYNNQVKTLEARASASDDEVRKLRSDYWSIWDKAEAHARLYESQKAATEECERKARIAAEECEQRILVLSRRIAMLEGRIP
jgi:predicted RNase H-like nuclease (RuvC/YqgF family)